jgi:hypothetical protein
MIKTGSMAFGNVVKYVRIYPESDENFDDGVAQANLKFKHENHNLCWYDLHNVAIIATITLHMLSMQ